METDVGTGSQADALWRKQLGPLLTLDEAAASLGATPDDVRRRIDAGELLALPAGRGKLLPAFQVGDGQPPPGLAEVIAVLAPVVETPFTIASWLTGPQPELAGETPAAWLARAGDPKRVLVAAHRTAALLSQ